MILKTYLGFLQVYYSEIQYQFSSRHYFTDSEFPHFMELLTNHNRFSKPDKKCRIS